MTDATYNTYTNNTNNTNNTDDTAPMVDDKIVALRVEQYRAVRAKLEQAEKDFKKSIEKDIELQNLLTVWLLGFLERTGQTSARTPNGTATITTRYTAPLADPDTFMTFVRQHQLFDLIDRRANATAVRDYVAAHDGNLPPGVKLSAVRTIGVRAPTKKHT